MLLHSDTKFIQGLLFDLLQMFLIFIAEQNIIIFFIYHTVERLLLDKDLLSGVGRLVVGGRHRIASSRVGEVRLPMTQSYRIPPVD